LDGDAQDNRRVSLRLRIRPNSGCVAASAPWPPHTNRHRKPRSRSRANWPASCGPHCNPHRHRRSDGRRRQGRGMAPTMTWPGDGRRRRRMIRGTNVRTGDKAMRYGPGSQLAPLDCTSSRRSTVMCALPRATAVTTVYQRDSSSKRPRSSVASAARAPAHVRGSTWRTRYPGLRALRAAPAAPLDTASATCGRLMPAR
jgi:hypothetical protein